MLFVWAMGQMILRRDHVGSLPVSSCDSIFDSFYTSIPPSFSPCCHLIARSLVCRTAKSPLSLAFQRISTNDPWTTPPSTPRHCCAILLLVDHIIKLNSREQGRPPSPQFLLHFSLFDKIISWPLLACCLGCAFQYKVINTINRDLAFRE